METLSTATQIHLDAAHILFDSGCTTVEAYHEAFHLLDPEWHESQLALDPRKRNLATMLLAWHEAH